MDSKTKSRSNPASTNRSTTLAIFRTLNSLDGASNRTKARVIASSVEVFITWYILASDTFPFFMKSHMRSYSPSFSASDSSSDVVASLTVSVVLMEVSLMDSEVSKRSSPSKVPKSVFHLLPSTLVQLVARLKRSVVSICARISRGADLHDSK